MPFALRETLLSRPALYHYFRQAFTGGMPFDRFIELGGLAAPTARVADVGCGPADLLRYLPGDGRPEFYLGIDVSPIYLRAAQAQAEKRRIAAQFLQINLEQLSTNEAVRRQFVEALRQARVTHVILMGVLHHLSDEAAGLTLRLLDEVPSLNAVVTQDVIFLPGHRLNNLLCVLDRGDHVRDQAGYEKLLDRSPWSHGGPIWTQTGVRFIKYVNFVLTRVRAEPGARPSPILAQ